MIRIILAIIGYVTIALYVEMTTRLIFYAFGRERMTYREQRWWARGFGAFWPITIPILTIGRLGVQTRRSYRKSRKEYP